MTTINYPTERRFGLIEIVNFLDRFSSSDDEGKKFLAHSPDALQVLDWGRFFWTNQQRVLCDGKYRKFSEYCRMLKSLEKRG